MSKQVAEARSHDTQFWELILIHPRLFLSNDIDYMMLEEHYVYLYFQISILFRFHSGHYKYLQSRFIILLDIISSNVYLIVDQYRPVKANCETVKIFSDFARFRYNNKVRLKNYPLVMLLTYIGIWYIVT